MVEKAKIPDIRFEGFTDPWEQRKAHSVFEIVDERDHAELPILSATQNQGMVCRDDSGRYIGHVKSSEVGYKHVRPGDYVVHLRSFQGGFAHSPIEGITSPAYTVFAARSPEMHSDRFWKHRFMSERFIESLSVVTYGIRDGRSISVDDFMEQPLAFPSVEEQATIGRSLDELDRLITLHQRKYDKLRVIKKSMLEKMFPKPGELYPEIRFEGFTDPWEQRKFGCLYKPVSEKNDMSFGTNRIISVANMYFNPSACVSDESYLRTYNVMRLGDIAFEGHANRVFSHGRFVENHIGDGIVSHIFVVFRPQVPYDVNYWRYAINNERIMREPLVRSTKASTMMHDLVAADLLEEELPVPDIAEQRRIGIFLVRLDSLITLHQRKSRNGHNVGLPTWEQRKLSSVFTFLRNNTLSRAGLSDFEGSVLNVHYGDVLVRFGEVLDVDAESLPRIADGSLAAQLPCQRLVDGDVIIADTAEDEAAGKCSELRGCSGKEIVSGLHTIACRPLFEFAPGYLGYYLNSPTFHDQLLPLMQGIKVISVSKAAISDTDVRFPSLPEQRVIGVSFSSIDSLITLHQ